MKLLPMITASIGKDTVGIILLLVSLFEKFAFLKPIALGVIALFAAVCSVSLWKIFVKIGLPGWKALIPGYAEFLLFKHTLDNGFLCIWYLIPVANIMYHAQLCEGLSAAFGKTKLFSVGLFICPAVCLPILAFGKAQYITGNEEIKLLDL